MITIRFVRVNKRALMPLRPRYGTKYRSKRRWVPTFPVNKIEWARLSNGSVIIGDPDRKSEAAERQEEDSIGRTVSD